MPEHEPISALSNNKWFDLSIAILMLGIAILIYLPSFNAPFHFDDMEAIVNNHYIRIPDLSPSSLFTSAFQDFKHNRPLTNLSLALNFYFNQLNPFGYHLVNFCFLIFTAFGLRLALAKFFRKLGYDYRLSKLASWLISLLWLAHPLNTQAITYIVQRHSSFAGAFSIWAFYFFMLSKDKARNQTRWLFFILSALLCLLAILSKETALTLPLLIFLFDLYFYQNLPNAWLKKNWKTISALAFFYILTAFLLFRPGLISKLGADVSLQSLSLSQRILFEPLILLWYPFLIIFPFPQFLSLEHYFIFSSSAFEIAMAILAWAIMLIFILLALFQARKWRLFSFALLWYLGQLAVEAMPLPIDLANEHRLYLALLSIVAVAVALLIFRPGKIRLAVAWLILLTAFFAWFSYQRNMVWTSRQSLWRDSVKKAPLLPRAWNNYCSALAEDDKCPTAIRVCQKALELNPYLADAHNALGICYFKSGEMNQAEKEFLAAVELGGKNYSVPYFNLGLLYNKLGDDESAIKWYLKALEKNPFDTQARYNLELTYRRLKRLK